MASGATVAQQWDLRPGIALSAAQISQLTSDIVWLVEQTVTLTDGSKVQALVPVVYLSQIHTADLRPTGALISGQSINIAVKGDLTNNGALQAQSSILLAANKVTNELGLIDASRGSTRIISDTDIINRSGLISGNTVQLDAARDILIDTVTRQFTSSQQTVAGRVTGTNTELGPQGTVVSRGAMALAAGRDVQLAGAFLSSQGNASLSAGANLVVDTVQTRQGTLDSGNSGVRQTQGVTHLGSTLQAGGNLTLSSGGDTTLKAAQVYAGQDLSVVSGGDLSITAAKDTVQLDENLRAKNYVRIDHTADERVVGSALTAGGNVTLAALQAVPGGGKGNITIEGSSVNAQGGTLAVVADGNVNVVEAREQHEYDLYNKTSKKGFLSSKSTSEHNTGASNLSVGSSLSGKEISIVSGQDITVRGSAVISDDQTRLLAANNVTIEAASNSSQDSQLKQQTRSGLFGSGGLSVTWGKQQQSTDQQNTRTAAAASTVGSIGGNVSLQAGEAYKQVGSDVLAPASDINISAKKVDIIEARETSKTVTEQKFKQSGLTLAITSPVISAIQTAQQMSQASGQTSDSRMQALAAATTALSAKNAYDSVAGDPAAAGGLNISITVGGSKSQSTSTTTSDLGRGSTVAAGGDVSIVAAGAAQDSDILVKGSTVQAGNNATLIAEDEIKLLAAANTSQQDRNSSGSSSGIGVAFTVGSGGMGFGITANASASKGKGEGQDTSWTNTQVEAGKQLTLLSGGDTTLKGAVAKAETVMADVGGNLNIESLQDTSTYKSKDQSLGGSVTVGIGFSGSGNASQQKIKSDFASVMEQSGIKAGDGGFDVNVMGNTDLKGAVIASTDKAVQDGKNTFTTGTLTQSEIQNKAEYNASSMSLGGGYSDGKGLMPVGGQASGASAPPPNSVGTDADGKAQTGAAQTPGSALPGYNGFSATVPIALGAKGSDSSTTGSGISAGVITISNDQKQQELTGKTADQTVASIDTNVRSNLDGSNALKPIFNEQEIKAGFEITGAFAREAGTFLGNRAKEAEAQKKEIAQKILNTTDPKEIESLKAQRADLDKWGAGGTYQQLGTAFIAAAAGNVTGSSAQMVQAAGINYLQSLGAQAIKEFADSIDSEPVRASLHAINACAGAAAQGGGCASGAAGAGLSSLINSLLADAGNATAEQKAARSNLLATLTAGVVAALGGDAAAASTAARIETENNALYRNATAVSKVITPQIKRLEGRLSAGQISPEEYVKEKIQLDLSAAKIDALTSIYNASDKSPLAAQIGKMAPQHIAMLGEAVAGLLVLPGMATSAYELLNGKSVSGEEANYFFAALGVLPGAAIGKGVGKAVELVEVLKSPASLTFAQQAFKRGRDYETAVIETLELTKNKEAFSATVNGKLVTVIPDSVPGGAVLNEIKDVAYLSRSPQFRAYVELVENGGQVASGPNAGTAFQFTSIELIVSPNTRISGPLYHAIVTQERGVIKVFDPATKTLTPFVFKG